MIARLAKNRKAGTVKTRDVWFRDKDGITAVSQRGVWLYQKFHSLAQVRALCAKYIGPKFEIIDHGGPLKSEIKASSFAVHGYKVVQPTGSDIESALKFEFNLPLPEGKRYGRGTDICAAWRKAIKTSMPAIQSF